MKLQFPIGAMRRGTAAFERRRGIGAAASSARSDRWSH